MKYIVRVCRIYRVSFMLKITQNKNKVLGIDNMNNYYSVKVKKFRNSKLNKYKNYLFLKKINSF